MCDREHYSDLEERVDDLDKRVTVVETTLSEIKSDITTGFADMKSELQRIYAERAKWSEWARQHLGNALKWAGAIIVGACGVSNIDKIAALFK